MRVVEGVVVVGVMVGDLKEGMRMGRLVRGKKEVWLEGGGGMVGKSEEKNELEEVKKKLGGLKKGIVVGEKI